MELYEQAVKEEEERLGLGDPAAAVERHDRLSVEEGRDDRRLRALPI